MIQTIDFTNELETYKEQLLKIPYVHEHMMTRFERKALCILACKSNQNNGIMEFGTWRGLTTHVLHCVTGQHIWTLDYAVPKDSPAYNPQQGFEVLTKEEIGYEASTDGNIDFLIMDSMKFKAEDYNIKNIDLCLVDGNHTYAYVKHDFEEGMKMIRSGGIIVIHDYRHDYLDYFKDNFFGPMPEFEDVVNGVMVTPHDGVWQFVQSMQHLNWTHIIGTNFIYTEKA